ncbi:MAG: ATP synthase F1 subunit delta [Vicinamibacteria bacterium]
MTEANGAKAPRLKPGSRAVAERYARAPLLVALDKNAELDRIEREVVSVAALLQREDRLASALRSPRIPMAKRVAILEDVLASAKLAPETTNLLRLLVKNERMPLFGLVIESFRRLVLDHKRIQPGEVTSAHPLTKEQQKRLAGNLGEVLGKTMELEYRTDPEIVGGLVVRIENRIFDASVVTALRKFKEKALSSL